MRYKYLIIFLIPLFFIVSCGNKEKKSNEEIKKLVNECELIVNAYDRNIKSLLDANNFSEISQLAYGANTDVHRILFEIKDMKILEKEEDMKQAAISYVESLQTLIKIQEVYSLYNDSIPLNEIEMMDGKVEKALVDTKNKFEIYNAHYKSLLE